MLILFKIPTFLLVLVILTPLPLLAEEFFLPKFKRFIVTKENGHKNSDHIFTEVLILNKNKKPIAAISKLIGPIHVSIPNGQILSCESNAIIGTKKVQVYNLDGKQVFSLYNLGFLRGCGTTEDKLLYWFHYNVVSNGQAENIFIAVNSYGSIIHKEKFIFAKAVKFTNGMAEYSILLPDAELPG